MFLWAIAILLATAFSWLFVIISGSSIIWYVWQFIYTGAPINYGILTNLDVVQLYYASGIILAAALVTTSFVVIFSSLKIKMKWMFPNAHVQLEDSHSLCVEAGYAAKAFKLKKPLIFVYINNSPTLFSMASMVNSAMAFDESILKPRIGNEYNWLVARQAYINSTNYSWGVGILISILWPYWFGRWLTGVSRNIFNSMQHQSHYLILLLLFLPLMFIGVLLKSIGKLLYIIQHPIQTSLSKKVVAKAEQYATTQTGVSNRAVRDEHLNDINYYPGCDK